MSNRCEPRVDRFFFLFVTFLFSSGVGYALPPANARIIDDTLEASFNISTSKMTGLASKEPTMLPKRLDMANLSGC